MSFSQLLEIDANARVIGFTGGSGRNYLLEQLASDLARRGKRIIVSHLQGKLLPITGEIICREDPAELIEEARAKSQPGSVLCLGKRMEQHFAQSPDKRFFQRLIKENFYDYLFIVLGAMGSYSFISEKSIRQLKRILFLDRLIYTMPIDLLDQVISDENVENLKEFSALFVGTAAPIVVTPTLIAEYLTSGKLPWKEIFLGKMPVDFVLTNVNNVLLENRAINLARELEARGISLIYTANFKDNLIKRITG